MANVNDALKKRNTGKTATPADGNTADELKEAVTQDPKSAGPTINAEHIHALAIMSLSNQQALAQIAELLGKYIPQHHAMAQAMNRMIPEHVANTNKINAVTQAPNPAMPQPVPQAPAGSLNNSQA